MTGVGIERLQALYAATDDPWNFRTSGYEQEKFAATRAALPRPRYASALEIGCGNGELARHLTLTCATYTGLDAVETALAAARRAVPEGRFHRAMLPEGLPAGSYDLIVLSEILYFLGAADITLLAARIDARWPGAGVICVTWRGPSGNPLEGEKALALFLAASARSFRPVASNPRYRIDVAKAVA